MEIQMRGFLKNNNILPSKQSGFRSGYSCATALADVIDDLNRAMDKDKISILILLDFSKAFDNINHKILLAMLKFFRFNNTSVSLLKSYLYQRKQIVQIDNMSSTPLEITSGVP